MNPLIFAISYCRKDAAITQELFDWISELGGCPGHSCLLTVDTKVEGSVRAFIKMSAQNSFDHVQEIEFTEPPPPKVLRWPLWRYFANQAFLKTAQYVFDNCRLPFLWGESDATPLGSGWLQTIADGYYGQPMKFYGPQIVASGDRPAHIPPVHMAGVAVYPNVAAHILSPFCGGEHTWDMGGSAVVVPKMTKCRLIQHSYAPAYAKDENTGWTFLVRDGKLEAEGEPEFRIREDAVLFHRCKDGSLIKALRQLRAADNGNGHYPEKSEMIGAAEDFAAMLGGQRGIEPPPPIPASAIKRGPGRPRKLSNPVGAT